MRPATALRVLEGLPRHTNETNTHDLQLECTQPSQGGARIPGVPNRKYALWVWLHYTWTNLAILANHAGCGESKVRMSQNLLLKDTQKGGGLALKAGLLIDDVAAAAVDQLLQNAWRRAMQPCQSTQIALNHCCWLHRAHICGCQYMDTSNGYPEQHPMPQSSETCNEVT